MKTRMRPEPLGHSLFSVLLLILSTSTTNAQIGTITQDISTVSVFAQQKECARSCFMRTGVCPYDGLGSAIGCATYGGCKSKGWEAKNDCYCRQDLQNPGQAYLTSCIQSLCTVGDESIDASTAGSIYAQYCKDKGYAPPTAPATIPAVATGPGGIPTRTFAAVSQPAATGGGSTTSQQPPSSNNQLPLTTIIGIVVGSVIGLMLLSVGLKRLWQRRSRPVHYPPPTNYAPPQPFQQAPSYPTPISQWQNSLPPPSYATDDVSPNDSISVVGVGAHAPTMVSGAQGSTPYRPYRN